MGIKNSDVPNLNMSNAATSKNGIIPTHVAMFGRILCAESILSKIYDRLVENSIEPGQYMANNTLSVIRAGGSLNDGMSFKIIYLNFQLN